MLAPKEAAATVGRVEEVAHVCAGASWVRGRRPVHSARFSDLFGVIVSLLNLLPSWGHNIHSFGWIVSRVHGESEIYCTAKGMNSCVQ